MGGALERRLRYDGCAVDLVSTVDQVGWSLMDTAYDCVVVHLPEEDMFDLLRDVLAQADGAPVIVIGRGPKGILDADDRILALRLGAVDVIPFPLRLDEFALRAHKAMAGRRDDGPREELVTFGAVVIDLARRSVSVGGAPVHLSPIQYRIVEVLARERERLVSSTELLDRCWDDENRDALANPLQPQLTLLRKTFAGHLRFRSTRGVGYRIEVVDEPV